MGNCCKHDSSNETATETLKLESVSIEALNNLFASAYSPLQTLSEVSDSISSSITSYQKSTSTNILKSCNTSDSIFGMFYIFSANVENVFKHICFKITHESPYLALDKSKLPQHVVHIYEDWENLATCIKDAPGKLKEIEPQIETLIEEAKEFPDKARTICSSQGVNPFETISSLKSVTGNIRKLTNAKRILIDASRTVEECLAAVRDFGNNFEQNSDKVLDIGKKARDEKCLMPRDIIKKFWPELERIDLDIVRKEEEDEEKEKEKKSE